MKQKRYWRSLDELSDAPEFQRWLHAEFPEGLSENATELHRRDFLRLDGRISRARRFRRVHETTDRKDRPLCKTTGGNHSRKTLQFATATTFGGYAQGIIVTSHEGRPTKIEGNPDHPASLGATTIWAQADILDLYDPIARNQSRTAERSAPGIISLRELNLELVRQQALGGAGVHLLTESTTSPTLSVQLRALRQKFPELGLHQWDPVGREGMNAAAATGAN